MMWSRDDGMPRGHDESSPTLAARLQAVYFPVGMAGASSYPQIDQSKINLFSVECKNLHKRNSAED